MRKVGYDIDRGYAWVVLGGAFSIQMIAGILTYSPGVTNIAILEEMENDLDKTSWIGSALFGTFTLLGPVAGIVQTRFGSRVTAVSGGVIVLVGMTSAYFCRTVTGLIITYGLITGFGICLGGNVVGTVPSQYFIKRRATAYGICISGGAMGLLISGPLTRYLLGQYGISGTLLLLGAITFHLCAAGFLFRRRGPVVHKNVTASEEGDENSKLKESEGKSETSTEYMCKENQGKPANCESGWSDDENVSLQFSSYSDSHISGSKQKKSVTCRVPNLVAFVIYNISILLWSLGESACMFHLPNYVQSKGSTLSQAASLFIALGAGGLFSRTVTGMIASDSSIGYTTLHVGLAGISGMLCLLFPIFSKSFPLQMVFSILYGVYNQGINTLMGPITIDLIGLSHISIGYGFAYNSSGIGYFLGPPLASALYRISGSYDLTFIFTGTCLILSSMAAAMSSIFKTTVHEEA